MATLATDSYNPVYAPKRGFRGGISSITAEVPALIESISDTLVAGGWTITASLYASGQVVMPFFFGDEFHPISVDGVPFSRPGGFITLASLAITLSLNTAYNVTAVTGIPFYNLGLNFVAKVAGPAANQPLIWVLPSIVELFVGLPSPGAASGGGYTLTSGAHPATGQQYEVSITETPFGRVQFAFGVGGPEYLIYCSVDNGDLFVAKSPVYTVIANPYQFLVVDEANANDLQNGLFGGGNSLLATMPWLDLVKSPTIAECVVIIGPGVLKNSTVWENVPCSVAINGLYQTYTYGPSAGFSSRLGLCTRLFPFNSPLLTPNNKPLIEDAWLMAPATTGVESVVIGKIWDGVVFSQSASSYGAGFEVSNGGVLIHNVSNNDVGVNSSFWLACAPL